jgi:hypothetical protein
MSLLALPSLAILEMDLEMGMKVRSWTLTILGDVARLQASKLKVPRCILIRLRALLEAHTGMYLVHKVNPVVMKALIITCSTASINSSRTFGCSDNFADGY